MKQSTGRHLGARQLSRQAALGIGMAAAVIAGVSACHGSNSDTCHYLPQANGVIGQANFFTGLSNASGVTAGTLGGSVSSLTSNGSNLSYVADTSNNRILGYNSLPQNTITGVNADFEIGQGNSSTDFTDNLPSQQNAATGLIGFSGPQNPKVDPANVYFVVADSGNNRVLIWNSLPTGNTPPNVVVGQPDFVSHVANNGTNTPPSSGSNPLTCAATQVGNNGAPPVTSAQGSPSQCNLFNPSSAFIANGQLIVVDSSNSRVMIWNPVPTTNGASASFVEGQSPTCAAAQAAIANNPAATTSTQAGQFIIASYSFLCNATNIDQFNSSTNSFTLAMNDPSDVWSDGTHLLVSDTKNHRVLLWKQIPSSINVLPDGIIGQAQFGQTSITGGSGTQGLHSPAGVASDGTNVFVADSANNRVLEYQDYLTDASLNPTATYVFGQGDFSHVTQLDPDQNNVPGDQRNTPPTNGVTAGTMFDPLGVYANASANLLYVTDTNNSRVLQYTITNPLTPTGTTGVNGSDPQDSDFCF
jgi:hypothetical protein